MCRNIVSYTRRRLAFGKYRAERVHFLTQGRRKTKPHAEGSHTTRMPHAARHSRPRARRQDEAHALGSLLDTLHSPSDLAPPATAHRCSSQPLNTAPPSPSPTTSPRIHAASVELSRRQHTEQQATAATSLSARVLHEAYGTGTALDGAMGDASTAGDSATGGRCEGGRLPRN